MTKIIAYIFLCLFFPLLVVAQTGCIKGKIRSSDSRPAGFVSVGVKGTLNGTITNEKGDYELNMTPGTYTLMISRPGQPIAEQILTVEPGQITVVPDVILSETPLQLNEVIVTGAKNSNDKSVNIGKSGIRPMDLPQSVASIEKELMDQQQTQSLGDAVKNFNGVYIMGTTGGVQQEIAARGFAFGSSNTFKNGVRFNNAVMPEMSALESVEVMKGSTAILFGNVAAGGVINLVTKKPTFTNGGEIGMRFDSYDFYKPTIDIYGVMDEKSKSAFRLNAVYEKSKSFRDEVKSDRIYLNPSFAVKLSKKIDLLIEGDYLKDNRTSDFGVGSINYALVDIPRNRFLGAEWSYYNSEQKSVTTSIAYHLNSKWQLKMTSSTQQFSNDLFGTARPNANNQMVQADGKWIRGVQRTGITDEYYIAQLDLTGNFATGKINHQLLIGGETDAYNTNTTAYRNITKYDSINIFDLNKYKQRNDIPEMTKNTNTESIIRRQGAYVQDLISLNRKIKILAGARLSWLETSAKVLTYSSGDLSKNRQYDFAVTPRAGLIYQPATNLSFFGSYANSFTPNTGLDINGKSLRPSFINQYEVGLKTNLFKNRMSANIIGYQITNSNLAQTSLANGNTNTNIKELSGEVTSQGVELDVSSRSFHGFMLIGGYSFNETKYTRSNTYVEGSLLRYNPNHTCNAGLYYTFSSGNYLRGLNLGFNVFYVGERQAGRSTRVTVANDPYKLFTLPAYTLFDATVGYTNKNYTIRFKISNLADALSYNVHDDNSVNPIAPRQFACSLSYKF